MERIIQVAHRVAQKSCRRACELFCCPLAPLLPEKATCCPGNMNFCLIGFRRRTTSINLSGSHVAVPVLPVFSSGCTCRGLLDSHFICMQTQFLISKNSTSLIVFKAQNHQAAEEKTTQGKLSFSCQMSVFTIKHSFFKSFCLLLY